MGYTVEAIYLCSTRGMEGIGYCVVESQVVSVCQLSVLTSIKGPYPRLALGRMIFWSAGEHVS